MLAILIELSGNMCSFTTENLDLVLYYMASIKALYVIQDQTNHKAHNMAGVYQKDY